MAKEDRGYIEIFVTQLIPLGRTYGYWWVELKIKRFPRVRVRRYSTQASAERGAKRLQGRLFWDAVLPVQVELDR